MNTPQNAKELNAAILSNFTTLECARAYIEFPYHIHAEEQDLEFYRRIVMVMVALRGPEDLCCKQIWATLASSISRNEFQDCTALLLVRSWFEYVDGSLRGRLGFYRKQYQQCLLDSRCYVKQGYAANEALRERE